MKGNKFFFKLGTAVLVLSFMALIGCATTVPIESVRTPTIDTSSIERLAIKPFEDTSGTGGSLAGQLTQYLTDRSTQLITETGKFTLVSPTDPNADGIFTGKITNITTKDSSEARTRKDKDGNTVSYTEYKREVSLEFSYFVINTRTDMPIGTVFKKGSDSSSSESRDNLADPLTLTKRIVDARIDAKPSATLFGGEDTSQKDRLVNDLVPYKVSTKEKLESEKSKDKVAKQKMKETLKLVKAQKYEEAIAQYDAISADHGSTAAKANAAILRKSIASTIAANERLDQLDSERSGLAEKVIGSVIETLSSLPSGSNITIMKTSSAETSTLDYVVDRVSKSLVQEGNLKVIDRSNQALISAEQQFQMSGSVSDDSIVSLGRQLGIQYFIFCKITGEKSLRRFNISVLNIETAQIIEQADFEI